MSDRFGEWFNLWELTSNGLRREYIDGEAMECSWNAAIDCAIDKLPCVESKKVLKELKTR